MCVSKVQHMMGRNTGFNRSRPVFSGFSVFRQTSQLATKKIQNLCNRNRWSGLLQLGSVRFRSFFQSSELDLRTLWLNEEEDCLATEDLWELRGSRVLGFPDLKKWLDKRDCEGELKRHDVKWKRQGPDSPKKNRDKDRPVVQRKHK